MTQHPAPTPVVSIILPTHNRGAVLRLTLQSLANQTLPPEQYEIIVVDNASSNDTPLVIREWLENEMASSPVRAKYVREDRLGLHFARHAGARAAQGEILAFTDDDAVVDAGWLAALVAAYDVPDVGCVGGKIVPRWLAEPPSWIIPFAPGFLSLLDLGDDVLSLDYPGIYGCNFSVRKSVLYEVGGFNPDSFGAIWLGDGETGLLLKVLAEGHKVIYTPQAVVEHLIPPGRLTLRYMRLRMANQGASDAYAYYRRTRCRRRHLLRRTAETAHSALRNKLTALRHKSFLDTIYYRTELRAVRSWGEAGYYFRLIFDAGLRHLALKEGWIHDV